MGYIRNLLIFIAFSIIVTGCGGGSTTVAATNSGGTSDGGTTPINTSGTPQTNITGSTTLKWAAPSTRADSSAISLSDISGYRLYYGATATDTPNYVNINDGTATQYTISLPSGSYYFRISAIDSNGYEGLKSAALLKNL